MTNTKTFSVFSTLAFGLAISVIASNARGSGITVVNGTTGGGNTLIEFFLDTTGMVDGFDTIALELTSAGLFNQVGTPAAGVLQPSEDSGFSAFLTAPSAFGGQGLSAFGVDAAHDTTSLVGGTHASLGNNSASTQGNFLLAQIVMTQSGSGSYTAEFFNDGDSVGSDAGTFGGDPNGGENTPPTVDNLFPGEVTFDQHTLATATTPASYQMQGTDAEDGDDANLDWELNTFTGPFAIDGVTPLFGTGNGAQALSPTGLFTWDPTGSALGFYFAGVTVTDSGGLMDTGILRVQVPEPGVLVLAGIGLIGIVASRRRLS